MAIQLRHYADASDYWLARSFLRDLFRLDDRAGANWTVADLDFWRWHWLENVVERTPDELCLWEADGGVVALLNQGDPGVCHLHVHPDYRTEALEDEMIATAESEMSGPTRDGGRAVWVWTLEDDDLRRRVLERRSYTLQPPGGHAIEHYGWRSLAEAIPDVELPQGFIVRSMGDADELPIRSLASWRAFHPDEPDEGCDTTGAWYRSVQRAPLYRRDLDVVVVAPNGDIASFATCYFDDVSRAGVFVLDGTAHPYQRMGLGKAAMTEGLRRLRWLGATAAYVSWYEAPAGALYEAVGFLDLRRGRSWIKPLPI